MPRPKGSKNKKTRATESIAVATDYAALIAEKQSAREALEAEIAALERAQGEWNELSARKSAAEADLAALEAEERTLDAQLRAHDLCDALEAHRAFIEAQAAAQSAEAEAQRFRQEIANRGTPSREALEQGRALYGALTERKAEAEQAEARRAEAEKALEALQGLTESRRLVGIISHVAELKERIERQVVVERSREGSRLWLNA